MTTLSLSLGIALGVALAVILVLKQRSDAALRAARQQADEASQQRDAEVQHAQAQAREAMKSAHAAYEQRVADLDAQAEQLRTHYEAEAQAAMANAQAAYAQKVADFDAQAEQVRTHYEAEARKAMEITRGPLTAALAELEPLRAYGGLQDAEAEMREKLASALREATTLQEEAHALVAQAHWLALEEQKQAQQRVKEIREQEQQRVQEIREQAEARLIQATRDAGRIVEAASKRAEEIGGDAYRALQEQQSIEQALKAIRNVVDGYGDRYVVPTHSLLDDLASDFGHTSAGEALAAARDQSRRMVEHGEAAECDYAEANRRETAIRFVIDAFNGRVDATLSTVKSTNFGTLEQEIRDTSSLVNLNGQAFRNARILPAYLDARLAELRWAVVAQELKLKEREEQRQIQEWIREEEKARREYERAIEESAREEATIKQAMDRARAQVEHATAQERGKYETQLAELTRRLTEAEAKNQRALSMAQQTRSGHVYIISNVGSFGEEVFKIGMTRRLEPLDRIKELGDASVPFEFDIHAMIRSEDAPTLERLLHERFDDLRINKVNYRKEFFRLPLDRIRTFATERGLDVTFTMAAAAREYRETVALGKMTPEEREKYHLPAEQEGASAD